MIIKVAILLLYNNNNIYVWNELANSYHDNIYMPCIHNKQGRKNPQGTKKNKYFNRTYNNAYDITRKY